MATVTRRGFLAAGAAASAFGINLIARRGDAAEFSYRFANNVPADYPLNTRTTAAAERIRQATGGRFDLQIFPNGQLGTDSDMLSQVRSGAIQFYTASGLVLSTLVPLTAINAVGFAFKDYAQVWPAMDGDLGAVIRAAIAKSGLRAMDKIFDIGFREITSATKPINGPADLEGFKIRIPASQLGVSMFKALGAAPATLNFSEVYTALQTRVVEGQENPLSIIDTAKFYEVQKYCAVTNHMWDGFWFLANGKMWDAVPEDVRAVVARELNVAAEEDRADIAKLDAALKQSLEAHGMTFTVPDPAPFRARLQKQGFYAQWREKFGAEAWALLEKHVGKLA
jgi:tripartite ATP-independent transporter DctP family solute receptor